MIPLRRRQFITRTAIGLPALVFTTTALKCGSEKVSLYVSTINSFLREISTLIPSQSDFISKMITVASDLDSAYRRGDFDNATTFLETLTGNLSTLITSLGLEASGQVKVGLAIVSSTVRLIAVLIHDQASQPVIASAVKRRTGVANARKKSLIESLVDKEEIDALLQASRP